jgi:hypothetical protein
MDALSQLSYTPVTEQNDLQMVWQTANILTNISTEFHCDTSNADQESVSLERRFSLSPRFFSVPSALFSVSSVLFLLLLFQPQRENFH